MEDIVIPMSSGSMEDIEQDGNQTEGMNSESTVTEGEGSTAANSQVVYEREDRYASCDISKELFVKTYVYFLILGSLLITQASLKSIKSCLIQMK